MLTTHLRGRRGGQETVSQLSPLSGSDGCPPPPLPPHLTPRVDTGLLEFWAGYCRNRKTGLQAQPEEAAGKCRAVCVGSCSLHEGFQGRTFSPRPWDPYDVQCGLIAIASIGLTPPNLETVPCVPLNLAPQSCQHSSEARGTMCSVSLNFR